MKIGIQGIQGSFSEIAAHTFAERQRLTNYNIEYLVSSENVLANVDNENCTYGIFAMENAQGGVVIESIRALAKYRCEIVDMFHVDVKQNLLTLPGKTAGEITAIYSHQQALRQCREYLADQFWGCQLIETDDTANAAKQLAAGELPADSAVIANRSCAELFGLEVFAENIHDLKHNLTLFLGITQLKDK